MMGEQIMKCPRCNAEVEKGEKYCNKCGKKIKSKKPIIITVAVVLAIALITVSVSFLFFGNGSPVPENTLSQKELTALSNENYVSLDEGFTDVKIKDEDTALKAVESVSDSIGIKDVNKDLKISSVNTVGDDTYYRMNQYFNDIPVYGRDIVISADKNGNAVALTSNITDISIEKVNFPDFNEDKVADKIKAYFSSDATVENILVSTDKVNKVIYSVGSKNEYCAYEFIASFNLNDEYSLYSIISDAETGEILNANSILSDAGKSVDVKSDDGSVTAKGWLEDNTYSLYNDECKISIFDFNGNISGSEVETDLNKYKNIGVNIVESKTNKFDITPINAMRNTTKCYEFYNSLGNDGFDSIHVAINDNYGNGNNARGGSEYNQAVIFIGTNTGTSDVDILAHEYTHAVSGKLVNWLGNTTQNGAINEGISDIFGELAECSILNLKEPDWKMISDNKEIGIYRNIKNPSKSGGLSDLSDIESVEEDKYVYSTVISHSAYLMWNGIDGNKDMKIDSDTLAKLWYKSLYLLHSDSTFQQCADTVTRTAKLMYKDGSLTKNQLNCVESAFSKVGLGSSLVENGSSFVVYDKNLKKFDDYHITIKNIFEDKIVVDEDVSDTDTYTLDLENGTYTITVSDNTKDGSKNKFTKTISVVNSLRKIKSEVSIYTDFGVDYDKILEQKKSELIDEHGVASTETYTENTDYLNAGWTNREGILSIEKADIDGDKINELVVIRLIKGNGNAGSNKIEVSAYKVISDSAENIGTYEVPYGNNTDKEDMTINAFTCKINNELCLIIESDLTQLYTDLGDISYYLFKCEKGVFSKILEIYNDADSMTLEWIKETYGNGEKKKTERINSTESILDALVDIGFPKTDNKFTVSGCPSFCNAKGAKKICTLKTERTDLSSPAIKFMKSTAEDFTGLDHSKASSSPEEPDKSEEWKDLYISELDASNIYNSAALAYINDDDIPELVLQSYSIIPGTKICWIKDNNVESFDVSGMAGLSYDQKSGVVRFGQLNHGISSTAIYTFDGNSVSLLHSGNNNYPNGNECYWDNKSVSLSEYEKQIGQYDFEDHGHDFISFEEIKEVIKNY